MIEVYQTEWCPHSSAIRKRLTELGLDFVARQVEPEPPDRHELREKTGESTIPVVVLADGAVLAGRTEDILAALDDRFPEGPDADGHRTMGALH